ncbi:MAG: heat-inducible transcription repressor HrcA [Fimbriimonadaceae bacterium]|nr:heat-inducible transcription repressor HrcA [Fimbriimonadaceae bacterium]
MSELDGRKQVILRAVVVEYVTTAEPIGSQILTEKYPLGVKSATVRNELAEMAELGFLEQPHTSAGRIPSDQGYRYFVDRLIVEGDPSARARETIREATQEGDALQTLLTDATRALSRLTHLLTAATTLRGADVTVRNVLLSAIGPTQALLVAVFGNGHIENRMIDCPPGLSLDDIGKANELLAKHVAGTSVTGLSRLKSPATDCPPNLDAMLAQIWPALRSMAKEYTRGQIVMEGEEYLFAQPEFRRDFDALNQLLDFLQDSGAVYDALTDSADQTQTVRIGRENRPEPMRSLSVVRHRFFVGENEAGTIALIGPTRMAYEAGIPLVSLTARAISDALSKYAL